MMSKQGEINKFWIFVIKCVFVKKIKNRKNKRDKYLLRLNTCGANYLKTIKETLKKEPLQI